jgi:vitamin B12 transporter
MEVGGRLNVHSLYGTNYTYTINPSFNITQQWQVFASIATGFKAPSLYQLFDAFSGNNKLNPEKAVNFQAGVQYKNHLLSARLVYFNRSIDNGIDYNYINFKYFNYIQQKVNGIEAEAAVKPTEKINLTANYTLINGTETTQNRITNKDTISYNYLLKRPKHNVNITLGYQATKGLYVAITGKYVSNRYDVGGYKKADVLLNNYFIMNAYAEYVLNKQFKVFADAQNITSKKFFDIRGYNSIPFIFNVGITFHL